MTTFCSIIVHSKSSGIKKRPIKFLFCLKREVSSHNESVAAFSALRGICIKARRLNVWVGNWRECVVSLGAPDARVLAFIALGERFLLDVSLSVATGGWFTCCRWRPLWISCTSTEEVAVGKLFHNCQCSILCAAMLNPTLYKLICVVRWYLECYGNVFKTVGVCVFLI